MKTPSLLRLIPIVLACALPFAAVAAPSPKVGDTAPDFTLKTLDDQTVSLGILTSNGPVVLIVLRGWPGYQCPICTSQVRDYSLSASGFAAAKARVLMVYPGPSAELKAHAQDFLKSKQWPKDFLFVTDPDYAMVNAYGLRWNAQGETAYPSTFIVDQKGVIRSVKISHTHGNRSSAADALTALKGVKPD